MNLSKQRLAGLLLTAGLATGACGVQQPSVVAEPEPAATGVGQDLAINSLQPGFVNFFQNLEAPFTRAGSAWKGFVPNDHPVVLAIKDSADKLTGAIAINHPKPDALGDATKIDTAALPIGSAYLIANPIDVDTLQAMSTFEFETTLGGVDSFAMVAGGSDGFFDPAEKDHVSTLLHEMFHRYQFQSFQEDGAGQDTENYAFTADNLETALLEERALRAAVEAPDAAGRTTAARHFAALRVSRLAADSRVKLDNGQERIEGVARYLEHLVAGNDAGFNYHLGNFETDLHRGIETVSDVKESFSFGRFYASGSAVFHLLDDFDVPNVEARVESGESPAMILAEHLSIDATNSAEVLASGRAAYDPTGELKVAAEREAAKLNDGAAPPPADNSASSNDAGTALSAAEIECLTKAGVDIDAEQITLTTEQAECLGG